MQKWSSLQISSAHHPPIHLFLGYMFERATPVKVQTDSLVIVCSYLYKQLRFVVIEEREGEMEAFTNCLVKVTSRL